MRVVIAAGGTGGHILPGVAVAEGLERKGIEVTFVGAGRELEQRLISGHGYRLITLPIRGFLGMGPFEKLRFPLLLLVSLLISIGLLLKEKPGAVLGCGGYVSFPVLLAGLILGVPTLISEQDSHPGLVTRILARLVSQVHLPTPRAILFLGKRGSLRVSGNPLRETISPVDRQLALKRFGLEKGVKTVLVFGGSQGARSINRAFSECLDHLPKGGRLQFIWITGGRDHSWAVRLKERSPFRIRVEEFLDEMGYAYSASDLVVSRAGGLATAEITALGLPSVLIPFPFATGKHQEMNARILERGGAARVILDEELNGKTLAKEISGLMANARTLEEMSQRARTMGRTDAKDLIVESILNLARNGASSVLEN